MKFLKKSEALTYFNKHKNGQLQIFAEDTGRNGKKQYLVASANDIFHKMKRNSESHFYEMWSEKCNMVFALDIDIKITDEITDSSTFVAQAIVNVMHGAKKYYNHDYKMTDVIVMTNDELTQINENPLKDSYHVVFRGLTFENHIVCKDFFTRLVDDYKMEHCDKAIYNMTCFRMCFNSKLGKKAVMEPLVMNINGQNTFDFGRRLTDAQFRDTWKKTMLTIVDQNGPIIGKSKMKNTVDKLQPKVDTSEKTPNYSNINIEHILFQLPIEYCDEYEYWYKIGMILHNMSSMDNDYFDLWDRWSKQSTKYNENKPGEMANKWRSFEGNPLTVGLLISWAKQEGIVGIYKNAKKSTPVIIEEYPQKDIEIAERYMNRGEVINVPKLSADIIKPHIRNKLLCIQSEKGTGKTYNLLDVMFSDSDLIKPSSSILFISSRRTFGIKLLNDLKKFKFELYSEIKTQDITAKRVICQIDSLMRLKRDKYDYVIIDECESLARYLTSSHFTKNQKASLVVSSLEMRITDANNTYIMDADLSDRCLNYYTKVLGREIYKSMHLIINAYKPYSDYTIKYMSYYMWLNKVLTDVAENKRLVIPMASNNKAKDLLTKINQDYPDKKVLLIHKETSDEEKLQKILKVNEIWSEYDIVIYTPSVCMGVSYDVPNFFDAIYAYGCTNSLGAQEFCQMLHRVRNPTNKTIYLSMDYYKEYDCEDIATYDSVEYMLCSDYYLTNYDLHNNLLPKKMDKIVSDETGTIGEQIMVYPYKDEPIYDLYVRNSMETINNKINFANQFFSYAKCKGYKLEYIAPEADVSEIAADMKNIRAEREDMDNNTNIEGIMNAPDITKDEYITKIKQRDEFLTEEDIFAIKRYNIVACYDLNDRNEQVDTIMTRDFIEKYGDKLKMRWYRNLSTILSTNEQDTNMKLKILKDNAVFDASYSNCYIDFTNKNKYIFHYLANMLIASLGYDVNDLTITINQVNISAKVDDAMLWCQERKLELANKFDIKMTNKKITDFKKLGDKIRYINNILQAQYGLAVKKVKQSTLPDKTLYALVNGDIWNDLNTNDNNTCADGWNKVIKAINIESKRQQTQYADVDTSCLDDFVGDTDDHYVEDI